MSNPEQSLLGKVEKDPNSTILKVYYDNQGTIERIEKETTEDENIVIYPTPLEGSYIEPTFEDYIPHFKEYSYTAGRFFTDTLDRYSAIDTIDFSEFRDSLRNLLSQKYERNFLDFLEENVDESTYIRFVLEQLAIKSQMPEEMTEQDGNRLVVEWPGYYPKKTQLQKDLAPLPSDLQKPYLVNKLLCICTDHENYSYTEELFELDKLDWVGSILFHITEIQSKSTERDSMIKELMDYYGFEMEEKIAIMRGYISRWRNILKDQEDIKKTKEHLKELQEKVEKGLDLY
jgi:hypothetical protein